MKNIVNSTRSHRRSHLWIGTIAVIALLAIGTGLRLHRLLLQRSLWLDEAMLCLNILEKSPAELLRPLDRNQIAPIAFLQITKAFTTILPVTEWTLRLLPFLGGVAVLPLYYLGVKTVTDVRSSVVGLALVVFNGALIYYSSEAKQYSTDAFWSLAVFLTALPFCLQKPHPRHWAFLFIIGILAPWFSYPSVFVLAAVGISLFFAGAFAKSKYSYSKILIIAASASWFLSFLVHFSFLESATFTQARLNFWADGFPPDGHSPWLIGKWMFRTFYEFTQYPAGFAFPVVALLLAVAGMDVLWHRSKPLLAILIMPALIALVASLLHKYPLSGRLLLFYTPLFFVVIAAGVSKLIATQWNTRQFGVLFNALVLFSLFLYPAKESLQRFIDPSLNDREEIKVGLEYISEQISSGDTLYVYSGANQAFDYYTRFGGFQRLQDFDIILGGKIYGDFQRYEKFVENLSNRKRVWLIFSHIWKSKTETKNEEEILIELLAGMSGNHVSLEKKGGGVSVYLYSRSHSD